MMKIWIIGYGVPSEKYPINGIFSYNQAKALAQYDQDLSICYIALDIRSLRRWRRWGIRKYVKDDIQIIECSVPVGGIPAKYKNGIYHTLLAYALCCARRLCGKPDIIHAHFTEMAYALSQCRNSYDAGIIVTEHSSGINEPVIEPELRRMAEYCYSKADRLITVSPSFQQKIYEEFHKNSIFIPNIIDEHIYYYKEPFINKSESIRFLGVGRLVPVKQYDFMISSFLEALKADDQMELYLIGDGVDYGKLSGLIKKSGRNDKVHLLGQKSAEEVAEWMQKSHCLVISSEAETFGAVCAEALMCGRPVISTRCGGPECMIDAQNGILLSVNDQEHMKNAFLEMKQKYQRYEFRKIAEKAVSGFGTNAVCQELVTVYQQVMEDKDRACGDCL